MKKEFTIKIDVDDYLASNMRAVGQEISYHELFAIWDYITFMILNNTNDRNKCSECMDEIKKIRLEEVLDNEKEK